MKEIKLTQGLKAQVDDEDFERLNEFKWFAHKSRNVYYADRHSATVNGKRDTIKMHHEIIGRPPEGKMADHKDGNGLNNQKYNLRHVTNRQNCQNKKHIIKTSQYPGVSRYRQREKWKAKIYINGIHKELGCHFNSEIDAFRAYCKALKAIGEEVVR